MDVNAFLLALFALGLAIGVIIAVGLLFIIQMKAIVKNETSIDSWIIAKAKRPRPPEDVFVYPYNLGWKANLKQVFCRREEYDDDDGVYWPVLDGCTQYTLTVISPEYGLQTTIWSRHWLYGQKIYSASDDSAIQDSSNQRGWFPRRCAVDIVAGSVDGHFKKLNKINKKKN